MESIKETELNLQREVVTTVPNTWLVEAVNPSTGEKKMIDIANYASVVAGQIGFDQAGSFIDRGTITTGSDLNQIVTPGVYRISGSSTNSPVDYGTLVVFKTSSIAQLCIRNTAGTFYYRARWNTEWSSWQRADNYGCNTLEELASGVAEQIGTGTVINKTLQAGESYAITESSYAIYGIVDRSKVGFGALFGVGYSSVVVFLDPKTVIDESKISITKSGAGSDIVVTNNYDTTVNIRIRKLV